MIWFDEEIMVQLLAHRIRIFFISSKDKYLYLLPKLIYGMKFTVQEFFVTPNLFGVQFFTVTEKRLLLIVQMIKSTVKNACVKGHCQDI